MSTARCSRARVPFIRLPLTPARVSRMLISTAEELGLQLGQLKRIQQVWIPECLRDRLHFARGYRRRADMKLATITGLAPTALRQLRNRV